MVFKVEKGSGEGPLMHDGGRRAMGRPARLETPSNRRGVHTRNLPRLFGRSQYHQICIRESGVGGGLSGEQWGQKAALEATAAIGVEAEGSKSSVPVGIRCRASSLGSYKDSRGKTDDIPRLAPVLSYSRSSREDINPSEAF